MNVTNCITSNALSISNTEITLHPKSKLIQEEAKRISIQLGIYTEAFYNGHHTMSTYLFTNSAVDRTITATVLFSAVNK